MQVGWRPARNAENAAARVLAPTIRTSKGSLRSKSRGGIRQAGPAGSGGRRPYSMTSIFEAVNIFLPFSSLTSPVALTGLGALQMFLWNVLLTVFLVR